MTHRSCVTSLYFIAFLLLTTLLQEALSIRCSVCDTTAGGNPMLCITNPPSARDCGNGHEHCINVAKYTNTGKLMSLARSCSPFQSDPACVPGLDKRNNDVVQLCYTTCSKSGCNGSRSVHHLLDLIRRRKK